MTRRFGARLCFAFLLVSSGARAGGGPVRAHRERATRRGVVPSSRARPDREPSRHALVVERYVTTVRFQNDGTGERELSVRLRVQTAAGALALHALSFAYDSASERMELGYLRVRKPDGSVMNSSAGTATVQAAPAREAGRATPDAPAYSSSKEFHVALPALSAGDTLEYEIITRIVQPPAPGQFWFQYNFLSGASARDERLEVSVPEHRAVIVRSPHFLYRKRIAGGRAIYLWTHTRSPSKRARPQSPPGAQHPPDVEMTSFANWAAVAQWYAALARGRAQPDAAIRAKSAQLTKGATSDLAKIQALYDYLSKSIRYVSIPLASEGYRPRSAAEIFSSGYANAKDEEILLAALLKAAGFRAEAALIPYTRQLELAVPSPAQFQHVLTVVPVGEREIWMDPTVGVAPFGLLPAPLRDKSALVVASDGTGHIARTPADPPFRSVQRVHIEGSVSPLGLLTARAHYSLLGDTELALRLAFETTPPSQWNDLGETVLAFDGIRGQVTAVKPRDLADFEKPFAFDIDFDEANFFAWSSSSSTTAMPLLAIGLPNPPQQRGRPIEIGSPLTVTVRLHLQLPEHFAAQPPVGTSVSRDFADFRSSYHFAGRIFSAERSLRFNMRDLPPDRLSDYLAFTRAVTIDRNQALSINYTGPGKPSIPESVTQDQLLAAGRASLDAGDASSALPLFARVIERDPKDQHAWNDLGLAYLQLDKNSDAASAFRRQLAVHPADQHAGNYLGVALERQHDFEGAIAAFRRQAQDHPLDPVAHAALGELLVNQHHYSAAISELEKGGVLAPKNPQIPMALGRAYLNLDKIPEAENAFNHAARLSPTPPLLNEIAYQLARRKIALDSAEKFAEAAVAGAAGHLQGIDLARVGADQLVEVRRMGTYWDTLGWVYFQQGDVRKAEPYVRASWLLNFDGQAGDHLAQIYEKLGEKQRAIHMFALALTASGPLPDTRARLTLLLGGNAHIDQLVAQAKPDVQTLRTMGAGTFAGHQDASADFLVLLSAGGNKPRVDGVRFVRGDASIRALGERLRSLDFGDIFPDVPGATRVQLIRRGTLACSVHSGKCAFTLAAEPPKGAH